MTEKQRLDAKRRENAHLLRLLSNMTGETYSQRHAPNGADLSYLQRGNTAMTGYISPDAAYLVLMALDHIARAASAKTATEVAAHYHNQYYGNPHNPPKEIQSL